MQPTTHNLTVRGQKVRTRTPRRFVVVAVRPEPVATTMHDPTTGGQKPAFYVAFARVEKRTDSLATARAAARRHGPFPGGVTVVVDTLTGEEV